MNQWFDECLYFLCLNDKFLCKVFFVYYSFFLGEIMLFLLIIFILIGILFVFFYELSNLLIVNFFDFGMVVKVNMVFVVYYLVFKINVMFFGDMLCCIYYWSVNIMVVVVIIYMMCIYFMGVFKKLCEINWWIGLLLLIFLVFIVVIGYILFYDNYVYQILGVIYGIIKLVFWVGDWFVQVVFVGNFFGEQVILCIYGYYIMLLLMILVVIIGVYMLIMIKQKYMQLQYVKCIVYKKIVGVLLIIQQILIMLFLMLIFVGLVILFVVFILVYLVEYFGLLSFILIFNIKFDWYLLWIFGVLVIIFGFEVLFLGGYIIVEFVGVLLFFIIFIGLLFLVFLFDKSEENVYYVENFINYLVWLGVGVVFLVFMLVMLLVGYKLEFIVLGLLMSGNVNVILWIMVLLFFVVVYFLMLVIVCGICFLCEVDECDCLVYGGYGGVIFGYLYD